MQSKDYEQDELRLQWDRISLAAIIIIIIIMLGLPVSHHPSN
jgi:hypothetical protein